jgi:hypothetical protein
MRPAAGLETVHGMVRCNIGRDGNKMMSDVVLLISAMVVAQHEPKVAGMTTLQEEISWLV